MAIPTIVSQLITLVYNIGDIWFIGQTNNPYMVTVSSFVLTIFLMTMALANLFGVGGGSLVMAGTPAVAFSLFCLLFMRPLLRLLGASDQTIGYAMQYLLFVVVIGSFPTVMPNTMSSMLRNIGYSSQAGFGLGLDGVLNIALVPLFMFGILPDGYQVMGAFFSAARLAGQLSPFCLSLRISIHCAPFIS